MNSSLQDGIKSFTDDELRMRVVDYELAMRVDNLSLQLHKAIKEWALHIDPTIKFATVSGNVIDSYKLNIVREINQSPSWSRIDP